MVDRIDLTKWHNGQVSDPATAKAGAAPTKNLGAELSVLLLYESQSSSFSSREAARTKPRSGLVYIYMHRSH